MTLLNAWWATWVTSIVVGWRVMGSSDESVDASTLGAMVLIDLLMLVAAILAFWVVVRLTQRQEGYAARLQTPSARTHEWLTPRSADGAVGLAHERLVRWGLPLLGLAAVGLAAVAISARPDPEDPDTVITGPTDVHVFTLDGGDCFNLPSELVGSAAPIDIADVEQVPCDELHSAEIYAVHTDEISSPRPIRVPTKRRRARSSSAIPSSRSSSACRTRSRSSTSTPYGRPRRHGRSAIERQRAQ